MHSKILFVFLGFLFVTLFFAPFKKEVVASSHPDSCPPSSTAHEILVPTGYFSESGAGDWTVDPLWDRVDEWPRDDDTTSIRGGADPFNGETADFLLSHAASEIPGGSTIQEVHVGYYAREEGDSADAFIRPILRVGGVTDNTSASALDVPPAYNQRYHPWTTNPTTGLPWTVADINDTTFGAAFLPGPSSSTVRITTTWMKVCYVPPAGPTMAITDPTEGLKFGNVEVGSQSPQRSFTIKNTGGGTLTGRVTSSDQDAFPVTGGNIPGVQGGFSLDANESISIDVQFVPQAAGPDSSVLTFDTAAQVDPTRKVEGNGVAAAGPVLDISPTKFSFSAEEGGAATVAQSLKIENTGVGNMDWTITGIPAWLTIPDPASTMSVGAGGFQLRALSADPAGLAAGTYNATIRVSATDAATGKSIGSKDADITFTVVPLGGFAITPSTLTISTQAGTLATGDFTTTNSATGGSFDVAVTISGDPELQITGATNFHMSAGAGTNPTAIGFNPPAGVAKTYNATVTFTVSGHINPSFNGLYVRDVEGKATLGPPPPGSQPPGPTTISFQNPLCDDPSDPGCSFTGLINNIINFLFTIAVILAPILLVIAGVIFMTAAGDPGRIRTARSMLLGTVIGFGIILISKGLVEVLKRILGI